MTSFLALTKESQIIGLFSRFNVSVFIKLLQVCGGATGDCGSLSYGAEKGAADTCSVIESSLVEPSAAESDKALTECLLVPSQSAGHCQGGNMGVEPSVKALFSLVAPIFHLT